MIAARVGVAEPGRAVALETHDLSRLRPRRNLDGNLPVNDRTLNRRSQYSIDVTDTRIRINLGPFPPELLILLDPKEDVQVSCGTAVRSRIALAPHPQLVSVLDSRGNSHLDLLRLLDSTLPGASAAVLLNLLSRASAGGARLLRLKVTKRSSSHLHRHTRTVAYVARADLRSGLDAVAAARVARFLVTDPDLLLSSEDGRLEVDFQVEPQVVASHGTARASSATAEAAAHSSASTEEGVEDVAQVDLLAEPGSATKWRSGPALRGRGSSDTLLAIHVVLLLHVGIVQNLVCAVNLLELLRRVLARISIGMVLLGHLPVRSLDLGGIGIASDAEYGVEVAILCPSGRHVQCRRARGRCKSSMPRRHPCSGRRGSYDAHSTGRGRRRREGRRRGRRRQQDGRSLRNAHHSGAHGP
mmetsp:Transcript_21389/g.39959  ORF Transcript_21389/g.39959 Transcript_21389/m.39959 type:complete len:414 (+) Transcript_21389:327-1568(+)